MGEIKRQSINNTILSYIGVAIGFVLIYIQPKLISSDDIGLLRLLLAFSWMVSTLMPLGIGSITLRFFPKIRNEGNRHNGHFLFLFLVVSLGAFIFGTLIYFNKPYFTEYYKKSPMFPAYFKETIVFGYILSLITIYSIYTSSLFKTTYTVFLTDVFVRFGQLLLVIIYSYGWIGRDLLVYLYIGIYVIQLVLMLIYLARIKAVSFSINWKFYRSLDRKDVLIFAVLMLLTAFASIGIKFLDQLMIGHFLNEKSVGIYAIAIAICVIMEIPFNSLDRIAQPKIAHAWSLNQRDEIQKIYETSSRYMFFAGGVLFCLLWSGIDFFFELIPAEYSIGKMAFYIMSFSSLINLLTGVNSSIIILSHKYFVASVLLFVLIFVSIVTNNIFIKPFGITGAAIAACVSAGLFNLLKYTYILIRFKMQPFTKNTLYIFICIVVCASFVVGLSYFVSPLLKAFLGAIFTCIAFSLMNIRLHIVHEVNKVFRRFKLIR